MTRIHVVSLPHTLLTSDYDWCAYTGKVRRFAIMLAAAGVESVFYGPDIEDVSEFTSGYEVIAGEADRREWFGTPEWDRNRVFDSWDMNAPCWTVTSGRAATAIARRWQDGDMIGLIGGLCQQKVITDFTEITGISPLTVEWGIGYSGIIPGTHRVYESYAWMHHVTGKMGSDDIRFFDTVIPNCYDPDDFDYSRNHGSYLLYLGRPTPRKGLPIIADIAKYSSIPIIMAGQPGEPIAGTDHVGIVLGERKAELLAGARALLCPTTYLEPFGGVTIEAMMSGTPVITTDYGAFTETVQNGKNGFRCRTLRDFLDATENVLDLDRRTIYQHAIDNYSLDKGSLLYGDYLRRVETLYHDGWYAGADEFRSQ